MHTIRLNDQHIVVPKVVCVGRNYTEHAAELGNAVPEQPVIFCKPNSAISTTLVAEHLGEALHYEAEIALLVQQGRFVAAGIGLDLTKRALQSQLKAKSLPWERAKAFDGSVVFSPFVTIDAVDETLGVRLLVDGTVRQVGEVKQMLFKPAALLADIESFMQLNDGDVVLTGTPKGVGEITRGSEFCVALTQGEHTLVSKTWQAE